MKRWIKLQVSFTHPFGASCRTLNPIKELIADGVNYFKLADKRGLIKEKTNDYLAVISRK